MKQIEHVVLLMMENRSFDSLLGWLYEKKTPLKNVPDLKSGERAYEGLQDLNLQEFENVDATGSIKACPIRGARGLNVPNVAPGESFTHVNTQLFEKENPTKGDKPTMKGYVRDYTNLLRKLGNKEEDVKRWADQVMQGYTPDQMPVLNGLAEHYAVCDMWFSSVPSQTNTNRAFANCGTSMGLTDNGFLETDPRAAPIEKLAGYKLGDDRFEAKTVFNALAEGGNTTWKIFRKSGMLQKNIENLAEFIKPILEVVDSKLFDYLIEISSQEVISDYSHRLFPEILKINNADANFAKIDEFHALARSGQLPHFSFIEPEWTIGEKGTGSPSGLATWLFHQGNDYHPPCNMDAGEYLVRQVYESLISNRQAWEKTLLIITFDEPVGSFDHVPPPAAVPPWGEGKNPGFPRGLEHDFNFDRYGGRVPAILASPWVAKSTVFRSTAGVPYDHTSLIATILKWRGLENRIADFGERTRQAPTFENIVSLAAPRTDERDVRFLKLAKKINEPACFYDRFYLRDNNGKYISKFKEAAVAPFSIFSEDSSLTEYFPTLADAPDIHSPDFLSKGNATQFYFQNAKNRPDAGKIDLSDSTELRLVACEDGLGSYNVLGAWMDSHSCYYFIDYMEGENGTKETWLIKSANPGAAGGFLAFGNSVFIENKSWVGELLTEDASNKGYLTTSKGGAYWTIVPVEDYPLRSKSFLSSPRHGYDFVVATTQASINSDLRDYLDGIDQPATYICYLVDNLGNPTTEISLDDLKARTGGIDPFEIPDGTDYSDPRITTLTKNMFAVAIKLKAGLPPGVMPKDLPPIVDLGSSANNVGFNLLCSEFQVIQNSPPSGFGSQGAWNVWTQPAGTPWYFGTTVNLVNKDLDKQLNTPYFNNHPKEKQALLDQLKNINAGAFSLQQLLFDLDNLAIQSVPSIAGLDTGSNAALILTKSFVNRYLASIRKYGEPILSVHAVANAADGSSLRLTAMEREVGQFVDGNGVVVSHPTPQQKQAVTLDYLCAANNNPLPGAASFDFNWVELADLGAQSGAIAVNRNTLANYYGNILLNQVKPNCLKPWTSVKVWPGGTAEYNAMVSPNNTPQSMSISPSGSQVLTISYQSNANASDKSGLTYGELDLHSSFTCTLTFCGNTITIVQRLVLWLKVQWDLTHTEGNIVDKTLTDTYTLTVGQQGQLQATRTSSMPAYYSQNIDLDAFSNFFVNLNNVISTVKNRVGTEFTSVDLQDIPANAIQNFFFPGGKVFRCKSVQFSENQDLVIPITYVKPG